MGTCLKKMVYTLIIGVLASAAYAQRSKVNDFYERDATSVYYFDMRIEGADPNTFRQLKYPFYARDKQRVYYHSFVIPGARVDTFRLFDESYATDGRRAFFRGRPMPLLNIKKFKVVNEERYLSADHRFVFFETQALLNSHPQSFQVLNSWYWKDKNNVYFFTLDAYPAVIPEADAETFVIDRDRHAHDKNRKYDAEVLLKRWQEGSLNFSTKKAQQ